MSWTEWATTQLDELARAQRLRRTVAFDCDGPEGQVNGRAVISFASNDYLGLSSAPEVRAAAHNAIDRFGTGALASRLVVGTRSLHDELEAALAAWKSSARALAFNSGYAANLGVLTTLATADTTVFSDALNHASIIDGCRLARARTCVYRHCDVEHLESLLAQTDGRKLVVTETVFSMDGDCAPLDQIAAACRRHNALLVLDEAHDVFGVSKDAFVDVEVIRVGTLSKTLGSLGGFVAGPTALIDLMINRARTFIFTTGLSPADTAAAKAALQICDSARGEALRTELRRWIEMIAPAHPTPIVPVILGADGAAVAASERLLAQGIYVPAIRPPTVPMGTARLRITLSARHNLAMVSRLKEALDTKSTEIA
ncbi:8-amino-7-oxononanoate synthase [Povalibacter uvarum]|uniref:8-amino-7-oxononanoate synthase n=1 Tax=Povalibacter uvarum TaxID=732238 RepID=A0A841HNH4_9GAMM|nr:8-amino-7-oxononanoate synthase [Povalibacter uvarum]MBB6093495.1 8-amino-7-oxononanoate synthase [Povalibacter uvarum]